MENSFICDEQNEFDGHSLNGYVFKKVDIILEFGIISTKSVESIVAHKSSFSFFWGKKADYGRLYLKI